MDYSTGPDRAAKTKGACWIGTKKPTPDAEVGLLVKEEDLQVKQFHRCSDSLVVDPGTVREEGEHAARAGPQHLAMLIGLASRLYRLLRPLRPASAL